MRPVLLVDRCCRRCATGVWCVGCHWGALTVVDGTWMTLKLIASFSMHDVDDESSPPTATDRSTVVVSESARGRLLRPAATDPDHCVRVLHAVWADCTPLLTGARPPAYHCQLLTLFA